MHIMTFKTVQSGGNAYRLDVSHVWPLAACVFHIAGPPSCPLRVGWIHRHVFLLLARGLGVDAS